MQSLQTVLFFVLGLAGLVGMTLWADRVAEPLDPLSPGMKTATALAVLPTPTFAAPDSCRTTAGSFDFGYLPHAPLTTTLVPPFAGGTPLVISGTLYASDCATPLPGVLIDVWQVDETGRYDQSIPYTYRARFRTGASGQYKLRTVKPAPYVVNRAVQPAHIHFRVDYPGLRRPFGAELHFAGDPLIPARYRTYFEPVVSLKQTRTPTGPVLRTRFDIVLSVPPSSP